MMCCLWYGMSFNEVPPVFNIPNLSFKHVLKRRFNTDLYKSNLWKRQFVAATVKELRIKLAHGVHLYSSRSLSPKNKEQHEDTNGSLCVAAVSVNTSLYFLTLER